MRLESVYDFERYEWSLQRLDHGVVDEALSERSGALNGHRKEASVEGFREMERPSSEGLKKILVSLFNFSLKTIS